jgi:diadenosine tetraphosphate (Ap4A) HIT family hydrolase
MFIYETPHFIVESHDKPFVSRTDGGHIRIRVKDATIPDRTKLIPHQAIELMRLTMIVGEALETAMNERGIAVVKVNYQDMGNWAAKTGTAHFLHVHVFGRSKDAVKQVWPESVYLPDRGTGFYDGFEPLDDEDRAVVLRHIKRIAAEPKYDLAAWGIA